MTTPPDWAISVPGVEGVHSGPPSTRQWENLTQQQIAALRKNLINSIMQIFVVTVRGVLLPGGLENTLQQIGDTFAPIRGLMELVAGFEPGTGFPELSDVIAGWREVLRGDSPLPAWNLFGNPRPGLFSQVSLSSIGDFVPNLLESPLFDWAESVFDPLDKWSIDTAVRHVDPLRPETQQGNSVRVIPDGITRDLLSDPELPVTPGQRVPMTIHARWQGLVSSSDPIRLVVNGYDAANVEVLDTVIASAGVDLPANSIDHPDADAEGWVTLTATFVVPSSPAVRSIRKTLRVTADATAGTGVWFSDASQQKTQPIFKHFVENLPEDLDDLGDRFQSILEETWNTLIGDDGSPFGTRTLADYAESLTRIPPRNILGISMATVADDFRETWNHIVRGLRREDATEQGLADVANAATDTAETLVTTRDLGEWTHTVQQIRYNKPLYEGIDETEESNFPLTDLMTGANPPAVINAAAASHPIAFWRATEDSHKGFISWMGQGVTNVTALYLDIYKMDYATNTMVLLHSSSDMAPYIPLSGWGYMQYNMQEVDRIDVAHGDVFAVCWRVQGTGTHQIAGKAASWMPAHPTIHPKKMAATRTGVGNLAFGSINYSGDLPWFGIGILEGDVPEPYIAPRTTQFSATGTHVYNIPSWANYVDVISLGAGGGGQHGHIDNLEYGVGGGAGQWATETLVRGIDFPSNATQLTIAVGVGGAGGQSAGSASTDTNGQSGGASIRQAIANGKSALVAAGGIGATGYTTNSTSMNGSSPGNRTYNQVTYTGGGVAPGNITADGSPGSPPGGGGSGGGRKFGSYYDAGPGANGRVWAVARQS